MFDISGFSSILAVFATEADALRGAQRPSLGEVPDVIDAAREQLREVMRRWDALRTRAGAD